MAMRSVITLVLAAMQVMQSFAGFTTAQWSTTIDVAGTQRMLCQRMSKEFLLVAKGVNATANRGHMFNSIRSFNATLYGLINGDDSRSIIAAPNQLVADGLQVVLNLWTPFYTLLQENVDLVRAAGTGVVNTTIVKAVQVGNLPILSTSDMVVGRLVDAAKASGVATSASVVDIAGRQRMLIQRMCKESLLIGLGVDPAPNVVNLKSTVTLFSSSHSGIVMGANWAGIPPLTKRCTMQQMREVTFFWQLFKPNMEKIQGAPTTTESQSTASDLAQQISDQSLPLFSAMVGAVRLYVNDTGSCNPSANSTNAQWMYLIGQMAQQEYLTQQISKSFMQVGSGIDMQDSIVSLIVNLASMTQGLRNLIEGSRANNVLSPPSQIILDQLIASYGIWVDLQAVIQNSINSGATDSLSVSQMARLSRQVLTQTNSAMDLYLAAANSSNSSMNGYVVAKVNLQRMLIQKIIKETFLIAYGEDPVTNFVALNASRDAFLTLHSRLLLGAPASGSRPAILKTTNVCGIQLMKVVSDTYTQLEQAALLVANNGTGASLQQLSASNPAALAALSDIVDFYTAGADTCDTFNGTFLEWTSGITEMGRFSELIQKVQNAVLFDQLNASVVSRTRRLGAMDLTSVLAEMDICLSNLKFGAGSLKIPAPPTQSLLDQLFGLEAQWQLVKAAITSQNVSLMANLSAAMLSTSDASMKTYTEAAGAVNAGVSSQRLTVASQQAMLARKMVNQALLVRLGDASSQKDFDASVTQFEASQALLSSGGDGIPAVIRQRPDLVLQLAVVNEAWQAVKGQLQKLANAKLVLLLGPTDIEDTQTALDALVMQLKSAIALFGIADPYVAPIEAFTFPVTLVVFLPIAASLLGMFSRMYCIFRGICLCNNLRKGKEQEEASTMASLQQFQSERPVDELDI